MLDFTDEQLESGLHNFILGWRSQERAEGETWQWALATGHGSEVSKALLELPWTLLERWGKRFETQWGVAA